MSRRDRKRVQPRLLDELEKRRLLAASLLAGNSGQILVSQFQPFGFRTAVGTQLQGVKLRGSFQVDVNSSTSPIPITSTPTVNSGLINHSQFSGAGFQTVGVQFKHVTIGGGVRVSGSDIEDPTSSTVASAGIFPNLETVVNKNLISNSQFNDGGFGIVDRLPDGSVIAREGRVGLQWRNTRVAGSVDVGLDDVTIRPAGTTSSVAAADLPGVTAIDPSTNAGRIRGSQVNDGGFGDIGMQFSKVAVGGRVATSTNTLFIEPQQDGGTPITIANQVFGKHTHDSTATGTATASANAASPSGVVGIAATGQNSPVVRTDTNAATNSGQIVGSQFNDGGFGDVGLQWKRVQVRGAVTAVHNSLTVQPENKGQGLITVQGIRFPSTPAATVRTAEQSSHTLAATPAVVASDGAPVTDLATPTGPISPYFPTPISGAGTVTLPFAGNFPLVDAATNSGLIRGGQFNAGGFGDEGLQWLNVKVGGGVQVVHNSLSVHPEGSGLAGISVNDVSYGPAVSTKVAKHLAVLKSAVISAGSTGSAAVSSEAVSTAGGTRLLTPPNNRALTNQQVAVPGNSDVFLQWNSIVHNRGLVLIHNIIKVMGVGVNTGPITLSNIRFPFQVPTLDLPGGATATVASAAATPTVTSEETQDPRLLNSSNNSGYLNHAQFNSGGFGDEGLQWRNVKVGGSVEVVHNTLAVDATADAPVGDVAGPITISNITFNSGALKGTLASRQNQILVSPPALFQGVSSKPVNPGKALPQDETVVNNTLNSGIIKAGQFASGGNDNHATLQWQGVNARGKVRVIDNVLSISVLDRPSGPITISNVTFA